MKPTNKELKRIEQEQDRIKREWFKRKLREKLEGKK
jgi:hypothetical protein